MAVYTDSVEKCVCCGEYSDTEFMNKETDGWVCDNCEDLYDAKTFKVLWRDNENPIDCS